MTALLTDMSEPLARSAGNALEVHEAVAMPRGAASDPRLLEVTLALGAEVHGARRDREDAKAARACSARSITSGTAAEALRAHGGELSAGRPISLDRPGAYLARAPVIVDVPAALDGHRQRHRHARGRVRGRHASEVAARRTEQAVNPAVGLDRLLPVGARVQKRRFDRARPRGRKADAAPRRRPRR